MMTIRSKRNLVQIGLWMATTTMILAACDRPVPTRSATPPPKPPTTNTAGPAFDSSGGIDSPADRALAVVENQPPVGHSPTGPADGAGDTAAAVTFGPFVGALPPGWTHRPSTSAMRTAEFVLPLAEGDSEPAELIVYYFGPGGAGGIEPNLRRWAGQFQGDANALFEQAKIEEKAFGAWKATTFELAGTYTPPPFAGGGIRENHHMFAAIVETDQGPYFFKAVGPQATMAAQSPAFEAFLASLKKP